MSAEAQTRCWHRRKLVWYRDRAIAKPLIAMLPKFLDRTTTGKILGLSRQQVMLEEYRILAHIYREMKKEHGFE